MATDTQIKTWFSKTMENAFLKTGVNPSSFPWFSNKPLTHK